MRPIDADELKRMRDDYIRGVILFKNEGDMIDQCPTLNVEPIRYGLWLKEELIGCEPYYLCSLCGKLHYQDYNFCNNCGAKMNGGSK